MKKFIGVVLGIILLFLFVFSFVAHGMQDYGFDRISSYDDFMDYTKDLKICLNSIDAATLMDIKERQIKYLESQDGETSIFVTKAGGYFKLKNGCFIQNVIIEKVIQGDSQLCGQEILLTRSGGISVYSEMTEDTYVDTIGCINFMKPENRYLVFCEEAEISYALCIPQYRVLLSLYSILNIDSDDYQAVSDYEKITFIMDDYKEDNLVAPYREYLNQEFMTNSGETLEVFLSVKNEILKKYNLR